MQACVHVYKPAMLGARCNCLSHLMDCNMKTDSQPQIIGPDPTLDMVLERIGGALTVARQITLPSGVEDAVIVAATAAAADMFGFTQQQELIGKLLSEVHERQSILQTRLYAFARMLGDPDAPNSYPACIRRHDGQLVWVHKEVEQRIEPHGSTWITQNVFLPQDQGYTMPKLRRVDEIVHEYAMRNVINPVLDDEPPVHSKKRQHVPRPAQDNTNVANVNNELLSEITGLSQAVLASLPFEHVHTIALPLRHAERPIWIHECKVDGCGRQWWSYTERPQHCPRCGSRLWQGESKWERRRVFKAAKAAPSSDAKPDESP